MYVKTITIYAMINFISLENNSNFIKLLEGCIDNKLKVKVELLKKSFNWQLMGNRLDYYQEGRKWETTWYSRLFFKGSISNKLKIKIELLKKFQKIKLLTSNWK